MLISFLRKATCAVSIVTAALTIFSSPARAQLTSAERAALDDLAPTYAQRFELHRGWYRGKPIRYFDIGPEPVTVSPVFLFVTGFDAQHRPQLVPGQLPVFSSLPGLEGYSGIFQVQYVVVRPGYVAGSMNDARAIVGAALRGAVRLLIPGVFVNYPIVPGGSALVGDPAHRPLMPGLFKGSRVEYFDFGLTPVAPAPIYAFITGVVNDEPQFFRAQANVVDAAPDSGAEYRDMWDVHFVTIPPGYVADTIRDLATLTAEANAGHLMIRRIGQTRNCPVVIVDGRPAARRQLVP